MTNDKSPPKLETAGQQETDGDCVSRLVRLPVGSVIRRGDKFISDDGRYLDMDNLGRLLGVRCLNQTLKKEGAWFRQPNVRCAPTGAIEWMLK